MIYEFMLEKKYRLDLDRLTLERLETDWVLVMEYGTIEELLAFMHAPTREGWFPDEIKNEVKKIGLKHRL